MKLIQDWPKLPVGFYIILKFFKFAIQVFVCHYLVYLATKIYENEVVIVLVIDRFTAYFFVNLDQNLVLR